MSCVMGFTHDPGPLPFTTIRDAKWTNRLEGIPFVEIQGEHGCTLPYQKARVLAIEGYTGECPAHLANVYKGKRLVEIRLGAWEESRGVVDMVNDADPMPTLRGIERSA